MSQLVGESTVIVLKVCPLRNIPLTAYSRRQASLVVSIWLTFEIRTLANNQNHSIILLMRTYQNLLQKNQIDLTIIACVSQASQSIILESGRRFSNGSKILVSKETVLLRRWDSVKHEKICFIKRTDKGRIAILRVWKLTHFQLPTPRQAAGFFCRSQVTGRRSQVTGCRSQVTVHRPKRQMPKRHKTEVRPKCYYNSFFAAKKKDVFVLKPA